MFHTSVEIHLATYTGLKMNTPESKSEEEILGWGRGIFFLSKSTGQTVFLKGYKTGQRVSFKEKIMGQRVKIEHPLNQIRLLTVLHSKNSLEDFCPYSYGTSQQGQHGCN